MLGSAPKVPQPIETASQPVAIIQTFKAPTQAEPEEKPIEQAPEKKQPKPEETPEREIYNVTAYALGDDMTPSHGITASGERVKVGRTLACPKSIPFGTEIYIPELDHLYTCTDRGGRITAGHLDIYFGSKSAAMEFGRKNLEVEIRKKPGE